MAPMRLFPGVVLDPAIAVVLQILLIVVLGVIAFVAIRQATRLAVRRLATADADPGSVDLSSVERQKRMRTLEGFAVRIAGIAILIVVVLTALDTVSINIAPAIAGLGVAGIAIGLGAQTLVRDWLAGIFILAENQYSRGDIVRIGGVSGVVEELSLRRTVLRDLDGIVHSVPNGQITVASNLTRLWARVNLDLQVAYGTDLDQAIHLLDAVGNELATDADWSARILDPPAVLRIDGLADTGVTLKLVGRVRPGDQWAVAGELRRRVLIACARAGVEMTYPLRLDPPAGDGPAAAPEEDPTTPADEKERGG